MHLNDCQTINSKLNKEGGMPSRWFQRGELAPKNIGLTCKLALTICCNLVNFDTSHLNSQYLNVARLEHATQLSSPAVMPATIILWRADYFMY